MFSDGLGLGIGLLIAGLVFVLLVWLLLRVVPRVRPMVYEPTEREFIKLQRHGDASLVIQLGGRIESINQTAREWFELVEGEVPNLERLARRIRPGDSFLEICAAEGQARFSINGQPVDAKSYRIPGSVPSILVSMQRVETSDGEETTSQDAISAGILRRVSDFSQAISSELSIDATVLAILKHIENIVPSDFLEIKLWDTATNRFLMYRLAGAIGSDQTLIQDEETRFGDYARFLQEEQRVLAIPDTRARSAIRFDRDGIEMAPMGSYLGYPLLMGSEFIGVMEVGVTPINGFAAEEMRILELLIGQIAIAIRNARLYEAQQHWTSQLFGLTNLSQSVSSLKDVRELFPKLVDGLAPLFSVNILGFLLYDEPRRLLEGQIPFFGLSDQFIQIYKTTIYPNSLAEKRILGQDIIISEDAAHDPIWNDLGLQDLAQAASMRDTALVPLVSAGRFLGYLQLSNHKTSNTPLDQDELRLLNVVVNQVSAIIENALLVQQARQRNQRTETIRRISSLVSSLATLDEILRYSIPEIANLLHAEVGAMFLIDEQEGVMRGHVPSTHGVPDDLVEPLSRLMVRPSAMHMTVAGSQRAFVSGNLSKGKRVLGIYRPLVRRLSVESAVVVPLIVRGQGIGELMFGSSLPELFTSVDVQFVSTVAGQLAMAIESGRFAGQTSDVLRRRADLTTAVSRIARELHITGDIQDLARIIQAEALKLSTADCGLTVIYDTSDTLDPDRPVLVSMGHPAETAHRNNLMPDVLEKGHHLVYNNLDGDEYHTGILSALFMPITHQGENFGFIELHSAKAEYFDEIAVDSIKMLGIQAAISLSNAFKARENRRRADALRQRADVLSGVYETSHALLSATSLADSLQALAEGMQSATSFSVILISLYDEDTSMLYRVAGVGMDAETLMALKAHRQQWASLVQMLKPEFAIGNVYFIPFDKSPVAPADIQFYNAVTEVSEAPNAWNPDDMLVVPLYRTDGTPMGLISMDAPRDGKRPTSEAFEKIEVFSSQVALTMNSGKRLLEHQKSIEELSAEVSRQKSLVGFSQRSLPMFLHKDMEQTIAISNLNQRAQHVRAGLQLTEAVSRQVDAASALSTLGTQILTSFNMSVSIIARDTVEGPRISQISGTLPRGANPEAMFGQRNPLRVAMQTGETILSANLDEDEIWHDTPFLTALKAKSFICMPVIVNNKPIAAVLATDTEPFPTLKSDDRQVYFQISRQISIILQNINLLSETRQRLQEVNLLLDFSRKLSGLDPKDILASLLDSALRVVNPAHAGVVLFWDAQEDLLMPQVASGYVDEDTILEISYQMDEGLPGRVYRERQPRRVDEVNFASDYNLTADNLIKYRKATGGRLPVSTIVVPVYTNERNLGVLILDNFNTPAAFRPEDEAILLSLTQQVALSLENVRLVQATQERAGQLQALNAVAATISSSLNREELVASLLDKLSPVIPFDTAILWLRESSRLVIAEARGFKDNEERKGLSVDVEDSVLLNEMIRSGQAISVGDVRVDGRFSLLVEAEYLSWLGIPLITKGQVIGVIAVEKREPGFYTAEQIQLTSTFASQAAVALDNAILFEESIRRAADLDERSKRLALLNQFSSELGKALNADQILRLTASQLMVALQSDRSMIILLDRRNKCFLLSVLPEEAERPSIYRSMPYSELLARLRDTQSIYSSDNVHEDDELKPLADFIVDITSLLILPLATTTSTYAIISQNREQRSFSSTEIELVRTLGNQAAIALENADLYQSTLATAERMSILNQVSADISSTLDPEEIYRAIHDAVNRLMPLDAFIISLYDEIANEIEGAYILDMGQRISNVRIPYGEGLSGRVIASGEPVLTLDTAESATISAVNVGEASTPHSIVAVPMIAGSKVIGMLSAQTYQYNAYDESDQQILSTLANQATVAIQNARLFAETQQFAVTLEQRVVERTAELEHEKRNTETLLRILTEVSSTLDLDHALSRTLSLLNEAVGGEQGTIMLVNPEDNMLYYRAGYGYATDNLQQVTPRPSGSVKLKIGEGLAGWVVKNRQSVRIHDLYQDDRWVVTAGSQQHRSAMVAPLVVGDDIIGAIMVFHRNVGFFTDTALEMVQAIGNQVAISINNAQLYELIRDQAERLGAMLRGQQMESSRQKAILEAVADGVLVTDAMNKITFVNASIEKILDLGASQLEGQSLENFAGLFGKTTQTWTETISDWSQNPGEQQVGETYAEQFSLDNGHVVLVHLAPIIWHNDFLGTVSIFRDITHEVEVDRLKSEFVATVSHELRTPMTAIRGYVDVMLMGAAGALTENQAHFLEIVKSNTERLNILVNDLLDISRIEAGRITLSIQSVDMSDVADMVLTDVLRRSRDEEKPMAISVDASPDLPRVLADPERIHQIVGNLVDNAYNYTPANGQIMISLRQLNGDVQVDVKDSGIGIAPEDQPRVFERFYRGEDPMVLATPGTGLGLPIVKQLVEMHNGKIWMTSSGLPGDGCTFSFTIPAEKN